MSSLADFPTRLWADFIAQRPEPDDTALPYEMVRGEYTWEAEEYGEGQVAVKIVDLLDDM